MSSIALSSEKGFHSFAGEQLVGHLMIHGAPEAAVKYTLLNGYFRGCRLNFTHFTSRDDICRDANVIPFRAVVIANWKIVQISLA